VQLAHLKSAGRYVGTNDRKQLKVYIFRANFVNLCVLLETASSGQSNKVENINYIYRFYKSKNTQKKNTPEQ